MKYEGRFLIGSNQAGKGDRDRLLNLPKHHRKKALENRSKTLEKIFTNKEEKRICSGCGKLKKWVQLVASNPPKYYCSDCKIKGKKL